ncbi:MAG: hypothetical protein ABIG88_00010 [Patescibacteria group bacterium]|nr:hypothetical protein [Patescibacteria group bacterium]
MTIEQMLTPEKMTKINKERKLSDVELIKEGAEVTPDNRIIPTEEQIQNIKGQSKEKYNPSEEEINKAEKMMTPQERKVSELRVEMIKKLEKEGKSGYLEYELSIRHKNKEDGISHLTHLNGIIDGHLIDIWVGSDGYVDPDILNVKNTLDGVGLEYNQAVNIYKKYRKFAMPKEELRKARDEDKNIEHRRENRDKTVEELLE